MSPGSTHTRASDGELNTSFKSGSKSSISQFISEESRTQPLTLTDIIAPLTRRSSHADVSYIEENSSALKSIYVQAHEDDTLVVNSVVAQAADVPPVPRPRLNPNISSQRLLANFPHLYGLVAP